MEKPEQLIAYGVSKQLPKNKIRPKRLEKLQIYRDQQHPYNFLPKFATIPESEALKEMTNYGSFETMFPKDQTEILYQTEPMEEFKDYKQNIDPEIEVPFEQRKMIPKASPEENLKLLK